MKVKLKAFVALAALALFAYGQAAYAAIPVDEDGITENMGDYIIEKTDGYLEDSVLVKGGSSTLVFGKEAQVTTEGARSSGARVSGIGSTIMFGENAAIFTDGVQSNGAYVDGKGSLIVFGDGASITTKGKEARGVIVRGVNAQISLADGAVITTHGENAYAAYAYEAGSRITFGKGTIINTGNIQAHGAVTNADDSLIKFGSGTIITTDGEQAYGAYAGGNASQITLGDSSSITTAGKLAYGAVSGGSGGEGKSLIGFGMNTKINTTGYRAYGAFSYGPDAEITFEEGAMITTTGANAYGATTLGLGSSVSFKDNATIITRGTRAYGVYVATDQTTISLDGASVITTERANSSAAVASGDNSMILLGDNSTSSAGGYSTQITTSGSSQLTTKGVDSHGVYAKGADSLVKFASDASLVTEGSRAHGAYTDNDTASIEFNGDTIIQTSKEDSYALFAKRGSITSAQSGKYTISGDMVADTGAISLKMADESLFTGKTSSGNGKISFAAENSTWNVTGTSKLTSLTLDSAVVDYRKADLGTTITVANLDGSGGTFKMKTDIEKETSDKLIVTGTMNGSQHKISVFNQGGAATTGNEIVGLVDTADETGKFELTHDVERGGWRYKLRQVDGGLRSQWELYSERTPSDTGVDNGRVSKMLSEGGRMLNAGDNASNSGSDPDPSDSTGTITGFGAGLGQTANSVTFAAGNIGQLSSTADAAINTFYANYLLGYIETDTLIQRLGDLRETPWNSGFWFRAHGGKIETSQRVLLDPFDMDYGGVQIGYDKKFAVGRNGDLYAGVMFGYSKGDISYISGGSGDVNSKMLGVYGTYVRSNGFFADMVLKYQWMDNDFNVIDSAGHHVNVGKINTDAVGASLEIGQRIYFGNDKKSGWYVEPQAQISYTRQGGGYFNASNGLQVGVDPFTSVLGRLGLLAGYETEKSNFYVKVSKVKEFDGDITIKMNSHLTQDSFGDNWWVYGIGFTSQVNDRNSMYFDLERTYGGDFKQTWALKAGWRIVF